MKDNKLDDLQDQIEDIVIQIPDTATIITPALQKALANANSMQSTISPTLQKALANANSMQSTISPTLQKALANANSMQSTISPALQKALANANSMQSTISPTLQKALASVNSMQSTISPALQKALANANSMQSTISPALQKALANANALSTQASEYLQSVTIDEIAETIDEISNYDLNADKAELDVGELIPYIENEISSSDSEKISFKALIKKITVIFGVTTAISFLTAITIPYLLTLYPVFVDNHQMIVDTLQEGINSLIAMFGDNLIAKATVKDIIQEENLSDYEQLNLIGLIRKDTYIRKGSSKNAPLAFPEKIKVNSVVNLLEVTHNLRAKRKQSWLKIHVKITNDYVEGWVEESKVQRFKKFN